MDPNADRIREWAKIRNWDEEKISNALDLLSDESDHTEFTPSEAWERISFHSQEYCRQVYNETSSFLEFFFEMYHRGTCPVEYIRPFYKILVEGGPSRNPELFSKKIIASPLTHAKRMNETLDPTSMSRRQIVKFLKSLCKLYMEWTKADGKDTLDLYDSMARRIRDELDERGGPKEISKVFKKLRNTPGVSTLEMTGGWDWEPRVYTWGHF